MFNSCYGVICCCLFAVAGVAEGQTAASHYQPPAASQAVLGDVVKQLENAKPVDGSQFKAHPAKFIGILPGGQLYFEVGGLDVDDDGGTAGSPAGWNPHPIRGGKVDKSHQSQTSYGGVLPAKAGDSDPISAFNVPYIVLPGDQGKDAQGKPKPLWYKALGIGIKSGDGVVVIKGDKHIVAVFADSGPANKIGEMSLKGHELFGEDVFEQVSVPVLDAGGKPVMDAATGKPATKVETRTRNKGGVGPYIVIVFPGSSVGRKFTSVEESLKPAIEAKFGALVGAK